MIGRRPSLLSTLPAFSLLVVMVGVGCQAGGRLAMGSYGLRDRAVSTEVQKLGFKVKDENTSKVIPAFIVALGARYIV